METFKYLMDNYGLPLIGLVVGLFFTVRLVRTVAVWSKPHIETLVAAVLDFLQTGIAANTNNAASIAKHAEAYSEQTPRIAAIDENVTHMRSVQDDPASIISNIATNRKLDASLANDTTLARAGIQALEALGSCHPELRPELAEAIQTLKKVERNA